MSRTIGSMREEDTTMKLAMQRTARRRSEPRRALQMMAAAMIAATMGGMTGCGVGTKAVPTTVQGTALRGKVFGGQNPVSGAMIQLYSVNLTGYALGANTLITPGSVMTKPDGTFDITGDYVCPTLDTLVYLTATGGNSGYATANPNLSLMTAMGTCGQLLATPFVEVNEVTTVASVWALSPFMSGPANVGTSSTNVQGITNAFADVNVLVDTSQGTIPGPGLPSGATFSYGEMYTLADILAACVNSTGGVAGDMSACGTLFGAANPGGTALSAPTDVVTAAVNIVQHPGSNVATLLSVIVQKPPFQPTIPVNDFTLAINFTGGDLAGPLAMAADAQGNIWITNSEVNTVTELSHTGEVLSGTGFTASLDNPSGIAFDLNGVAWITNQGNNTLSLMNDGVAVGLPLSGGGLDGPTSIAFDFLGNAWIANGPNASVSEFNSSYAAVSATGYTGSGITAPIAVAVSPH